MFIATATFGSGSVAAYSPTYLTPSQVPLMMAFNFSAAASLAGDHHAADADMSSSMMAAPLAAASLVRFHHDDDDEEMSSTMAAPLAPSLADASSDDACTMAYALLAERLTCRRRVALPEQPEQPEPPQRQLFPSPPRSVPPLSAMRAHKDDSQIHDMLSRKIDQLSLQIQELHSLQIELIRTTNQPFTCTSADDKKKSADSAVPHTPEYTPTACPYTPTQLLSDDECDGDRGFGHGNGSGDGDGKADGMDGKAKSGAELSPSSPGVTDSDDECCPSTPTQIQVPTEIPSPTTPPGPAAAVPTESEDRPAKRAKTMDGRTMNLIDDTETVIML